MLLRVMRSTPNFPQTIILAMIEKSINHHPFFILRYSICGKLWYSCFDNKTVPKNGANILKQGAKVCT